MPHTKPYVNKTHTRRRWLKLRVANLSILYLCYWQSHKSKGRTESTIAIRASKKIIYLGANGCYAACAFNLGVHGLAWTRKQHFTTVENWSGKNFPSCLCDGRFKGTITIRHYLRFVFVWLLFNFHGSSATIGCIKKIENCHGKSIVFFHFYFTIITLNSF